MEMDEKKRNIKGTNVYKCVNFGAEVDSLLTDF